MDTFCPKGCELDKRRGWLPVLGCVVHDPSSREPEPTVPCTMCGFDLRTGLQHGGTFTEVATSHMTGFHGLGPAAASREINKSEQAARA